MLKAPAMRTLGWLILFVLPLACAHHPDKFLSLHPGMSQAEVLHLLGRPDDRSFGDDGRETWTYETLDLRAESNRVKIISFKNGRVVGLKNDYVAEERHHEIARARAGAPKITFNRYARGRCRTSSFGHHPEGGGCNVFGCWPAGGECTAFGCSASSHCGAVSCPDKIEGPLCAE